MEMHLYDIICFVTFLLTIILTIVFMIKADDENALRRITAGLGFTAVYFNKEIGKALYLTLGSLLETFIATAGVGLVIVTIVVIVLLPILIVTRWMYH